ncbi:hypothetical protein V3C99_019053 [Haemonchus contortus]
MRLILLLITTLFILSASGEERECARNICLNGGTCLVDDISRRFSCRCPPGFAGSLCQEACTLKCANGVCVKGTLGKEQCQCTQGWSGALCEVSGSSLEGCTRTEDCGIGERCIENDRGLKICAGDPCETRPCKNNATCVADNDSFQCICSTGFAGRLCDSDINECELMPCQHGGTCINVEGSFECLCDVGYSGSQCENEAITCAARPCLNQGTCMDTQTGFYCICPFGYEGKTCQNEKATSECRCPDPLHKCTLVEGRPICTCPDGFTGPKCEESVPGCDSNPCRNGGRCQNIPGGFQCYCSPEFGGKTCDKAITCLVDGSYCLNGGRCVRGLSANHCECAGNFTGTHCERSTVIPLQGPCDSNPCLNGGICHADGNIATCECPPGFGGDTCSDQQGTTSSSCSTNPCQNGGTCQAIGDPLEDGFLCNCPIGFEGNLCERVATEWQSSVEEITLLSTVAFTFIPASTTPIIATTNSSQIGCDSCVHSDKCVETTLGALCICHSGYQGTRCDQQGEPCDSVSCTPPLVCQPLVAVSGVRTTCKCPIGWTGPKCLENTAVSFNESSLFIHQSPSVMIGSSSGPLPYAISFAMRTTVPTVHIASGENIFGQQLFSIGLNDGYIVVAIHGTTFNKLIPFNINDGTWYTVRLEKTDQDVLISVTNEAGYQLLLRSLPRMTSFDVFATRVGKIGDSEHFVGCLADFSLDNSNAIDLAMSSRGTGIIHGCKHTVQCSKNPCLNGGTCLDFWTHSTCVCPAPFLPPLCMNSLAPSTFGHLNKTSFAEISISPEMSQNLRFSTIIQVILRSNQPNGTVVFLGETGDELATFISLSLVDGHVVVRSRAGGKSVHELKSHRLVTDNKDHIIRVRRQRRHIKLEIDEILDSEGTIQSRFDHPLFAERLQLSSSRNVTEDAFTNKKAFKGSLQDIRVNEKSVVLHEPASFSVERLGNVANLENVLEGTISDDVCSMSEQCVHGSCFNTFNDFECRCEKGYFGRRCERKDHCLDSPCPNGGECENVGDGFLCTSPVTIKTVSVVTFKMSEPVETGSVVKLSIRTHSEDGHILTLESEEKPITLSLENGQPVVTGVVPVPIRKTIADGLWHTLELNENVLYVDSASYGLPEMVQLPSRIHPASLQFGAVDGASFDGCLKNITVGDLPRLSFYKEDEVGQPGNVTHWMIDKRLKIATGCLSSQQCGDASPCIRGECHDLWNAYACECPHGFEGAHCEVKRDECSKIECGRGQCVDGVEGPRCRCDSGFTGEACDAEMDLCSLIPCKNGGLCSSSDGNYTCECKPGWTGKSCDIRDQPVCYDGVCKNGGTCEPDVAGGIKCVCKAGFFGRFCEEHVDPCEKRPCDHGYCKPSASDDFECECEEGYTGKTCSELTDMCTTTSCNGRGRCTPVWNATMCTCDKRWRGAACTHLVDECLFIPCENDGICETTEQGFKCHCKKYYLGDRCELQGTCLTHPCERGECVQLSYDSHSCSCPKGYEGTRCETRIDYCKRNPCLNGGSCESLFGEHKCHCISGFTGTNCEMDIDECLLGFCANGAKCRDRIADYECICDGTGFSGKNCTDDINECSVASNCVNGQCTNTRGGYRCDCEKGFIGSRCTVRDPCRPDSFNRTTHTCVHGVCINPVVKIDSAGRETAMHECKCSRGYTGPQCTTQVSERKVLGVSYILGPMAAVLAVLTILGCVLLAFVFRGKRALHGHYSPSHQERNGARVQMNSMVKLPPEERLI